MTHIRRYIRAAALLLPLLGTLVACKDFLEEDVRSTIVTDTFYQTESDAQAALLGVYDMVASFNLYNNAIWWMADLSTDDASPGPGVNNVNILQIEAYTHGAINDRIELHYRGSYIGINRANAVIARVPQAAQVSAESKKRIVAQAKFMRALFYFNLVRFFGDVPMPLQETVEASQATLPRTPADAVYAQIISDLNEALPDLPATYTGNNVGRVTSGAVNALLAKVYLTRKDWVKAGDAAKKVIDTKVYSLLPNYADVFDVTKKNHAESVFDAQFKAGVTTEGSQLLLFAGPNQSQQTPRIFTGLNSSYLPDPTFADTTKSWRRGDQRVRTALMYRFTYNNTTARLTRPHIGKYIDNAALASNFRDAGNNFPVIRYADVLLLYAEALAEQGKPTEAIPFLNDVRRRGFGLKVGTPSTLTDFPNTQDRALGWTLTRAIYEERRWELCFEGHRWFDLVRTGRLLEVMKAAGNANIRDFHTLYPIPQRDRDINPALEQNPGYN
jgi:starch-binding outer membrane protein, SusD/RagB family